MEFTSNCPKGIKLINCNEVSNKKKSGSVTTTLHVPFAVNWQTVN